MKKKVIRNIKATRKSWKHILTGEKKLNNLYNLYNTCYILMDYIIYRIYETQ